MSEDTSPILEEITPPDSVVPVYSLPLTEEVIFEISKNLQADLDLAAEQSAKAAARETALKKLINLGLSSDEATALIGT